MHARDPGTAEPDLAGLAVARWHSERLRVMCMLALFGAIAAIGLSRILFVVDGKPALGWIVLGVSLVFFAGEAYVLSFVRRAMDAQQPLDRRFAAVHAIAECVYPIAVLFVLMAVNPNGRYTLLVSPGYAFLMILIAISVLRVDAGVTAWTGALATVGYAAFSRPPPRQRPPFHCSPAASRPRISRNWRLRTISSTATATLNSFAASSFCISPSSGSSESCTARPSA
jgi:hypothetical protein